jgi:hypothetical protein
MTAWRGESLAANPLGNTSTRYEWNTYEGRLFRYTDAWHYYSNTVYGKLQKYFTAKRLDQRLYKYIIPIYNPTFRLAETYVSKLYGGVLDMENLTNGAIPIVTANEAVKVGLRQVWKSSNWGTKKSLYSRYAAILGDVMLKIHDDPLRQKVSIEVLHPGIFQDVTFDSAHNVKAYTIVYTDVDDKGKEYEYKETAIKDGDAVIFETFKNNEPFGFYADASGNAVSQWSNNYGFVPVVAAQFMDIGEQWGASAIYSAWSKIDTLNDLASLLNRGIRKEVVRPLKATGLGAEVADIAVLGDPEDIPIMKLPAGATLDPIPSSLDVAATQGVINELLTELERDLPELTLPKIRESGNLTAPGVQAAYSDAISRFEEARGNLDSAMVRANQMALSIGAMQRYPGYEGIGPNAYANGDLEHQIGERPVITDALTKFEELQALGQVNTAGPVAKLLLKKLGYSDADAEFYAVKVAEANAQALAQQQQGAVGGQGALSDMLGVLGRTRRGATAPAAALLGATNG